MTDKARTTDVEILRQCVDRIIESGALGRGHLNAKLLNYLAERAVRGEVPKEFDISVDVFHKSTSSADIADAQTRVHIYKLRARLEAYYARAGKTDAFRLDIPKGTYQLVATANDGPSTLESDRPRHGALRIYAVSGLLAASLLFNVMWLGGFPRHAKPPEARSAVWAALGDSGRPVLVVLGDHFFFGETGSHVRTRDIAINSDADLRSSPSYGAKPGLVFETLSYLPRSSAFALQTLLPRAAVAPENITLKLVSELTPEDLRTHDIVYVGFVRAMGILRDYYLTRSNFKPDTPLFLSLTDSSSGDVLTRSGPAPEYNRDYGLFARLTGPAGNRIVVVAGIGDVGVSAVMRAMHSDSDAERSSALRAAGVDDQRDFELLIEAKGHSRTDLDFTLLRALPLHSPDLPAVPGPAPAHAPAGELRAGP